MSSSMPSMPNSPLPPPGLPGAPGVMTGAPPEVGAMGKPVHESYQVAAPTYVSGRRLAMQALDAMMADPHNLQKLNDAMQEAFETDPLGFYRDVVVPLTPKGIVEETAGMGSGGAPAQITVNIQYANGPIFGRTQ